ncbi:MAG: hypothetical protein L6R40_003468 [Gallowayella cf. fulva]|nr:MAG: hypothetical protein L6R40_003468 [Xanthomendoza cf. fulva]
MKFNILLATLVALLPVALAVPATADIDDSISTNTLPLADPTPAATIESTLNDTAVAPTDSAVDLDDDASYETMQRENEIVERRATKNSGLVIKVYRNRNCQGPIVPFTNVQYDHGYFVRFQSYSISRRLKLGETLSLYGTVGKNWCGRETSHTPQQMSAGCKPLGGGSAGGASCFKLWRRQGFIY